MTQSLRQRFDLSGKVALVTGASKGIGETIARGFSEFGAKVVVSSRKQEAVDAVAASIRERGGEATAVAAHVGDVDQARALVDRAVELYGGIDIVVNNAAANPYFGALVNAPDGVFEKIMAVNVKGPLEIARRAFASMEARGGGSIINISSIGGVSPEPMLGIYSVSKAALISLTKVMAREWGPANVRANVICPGLIQTKFSAALWSSEEVLAQFLSDLPLGRIGQAEDIAPLAIFLASDAAAYCSGAAFVADGGHLI